MARAAELAQQYSPAWLDINMGCPAPKIAGNRSGSALMLEPDRAESIIRAVKEASSIPVTVKFRKGWDDSHINAVEFAQMAEAAGADAVTVHGRTRQPWGPRGCSGRCGSTCKPGHMSRPLRWKNAWS